MLEVKADALEESFDALLQADRIAGLAAQVTNKPFVNFYAVRRIGGAVANSEAIKLMKFAAL